MDKTESDLKEMVFAASSQMSSGIRVEGRREVCTKRFEGREETMHPQEH